MAKGTVVEDMKRLRQLMLKANERVKRRESDFREDWTNSPALKEAVDDAISLRSRLSNMYNHEVKTFMPDYKDLRNRWMDNCAPGWRTDPFLPGYGKCNEIWNNSIVPNTVANRSPSSEQIALDPLLYFDSDSKFVRDKAEERIIGSNNRKNFSVMKFLSNMFKK